MEEFSFSLGDISAKMDGEISFWYVAIMEASDYDKETVKNLWSFELYLWKDSIR